MAVVQVFENVWLGLTCSQWIIVIEMVVIAFLILGLIAMMWMAGPTLGYIQAQMRRVKSVGILLQNYDVTIKPMEYFAEIFHGLGLTWVQRKKENLNFGAKNCEIIADFWGITINAKDNLAIKELINNWNDSDFEDDEFPAPDKREAIVDYESLYAALDALPLDHQIRIRAFTYVPIYELKSYLEPASAAMLTANNESLKSCDEEKANAAAGSSGLWLLIAFIGGIATCFVLTKLL